MPCGKSGRSQLTEESLACGFAFLRLGESSCVQEDNEINIELVDVTRKGIILAGGPGTSLKSSNRGESDFLSRSPRRKPKGAVSGSLSLRAVRPWTGGMKSLICIGTHGQQP